MPPQKLDNDAKNETFSATFVYTSILFQKEEFRFFFIWLTLIQNWDHEQGRFLWVRHRNFHKIVCPYSSMHGHIKDPMIPPCYIDWVCLLFIINEIFQILLIVFKSQFLSLMRLSHCWCLTKQTSVSSAYSTTRSTYVTQTLLIIS